MIIIHKVSEIVKFREERLQSISTGFVPTMGALHKGHISLVEKSVKENDYTIVSIFVNPKQFNDKNDFLNYPTTIDKDIELLKKTGCNLVFIPESEDIYNYYYGISIDFQGLDTMYEGKYRPGHFQGVVDVVYRLFDIIRPNNSYFGEKDFQQLAIIKLMVKQLNIPIKIIAGEIVRENNGLAMSSRNERLSAVERENAARIYEVLKNAKKTIKIGDSAGSMVDAIKNRIDQNPFLKTEYIAFCDSTNLKPISSFSENTVVRLCVAVWCGKIRLIDNINLQF
ncbi:MAG TPA: pantoate--beta-alanine ligase [Bacteroidales bacterium]|nr:pantoate--beta-alanine ligase [Bacteroidales bacterium]